MVLSMPSPPLAPPILSTLSQSFFSSPESSSGFSSAFRPARLSSVVGFVRLLVRTVFSLVLCHDAVFGWSDRPSILLHPPFFSLMRVSSLGLQEHVTMSFVDEVDGDGDHLYTLQLLHHLPNRLQSVQPRELQGSRLACHQLVQNSISARRAESAHCCTYICAWQFRGEGGGWRKKCLPKKLQIIYYDVCITALHKAGGEVETAVASFSST